MTTPETLDQIRDWIVAHDARNNAIDQDAINDKQSGKIGKLETAMSGHLITYKARERRVGESIEALNRSTVELSQTTRDLESSVAEFKNKTRGGWLTVVVVAIVITNLLTLALAAASLLTKG